MLENIRGDLIDFVPVNVLLFRNMHLFTRYNITVISTRAIQTRFVKPTVHLFSLSLSKVWGHEMKHEFQADKSARQRRKPCDTHINTALMQSDIIVEFLCWEIRAVSPRGFSVAHIRTRLSKMYERQDKVLNNSVYRREQFLYCRYVNNNDKPGNFNMRERQERNSFTVLVHSGVKHWKQ